MATLIYQHNTTGERWAIRINAQDEIIDATGPLYYGDIPALLEDDWDGDPETTAEFQESGLSEYHEITKEGLQDSYDH